MIVQFKNLNVTYKNILSISMRDFVLCAVPEPISVVGRTLHSNKRDKTKKLNKLEK